MEKEAKQRTLRQNKALHKYFTYLAAGLNASGFDMKKTLKESVEIPWTPETVKDWLWRPIQQAQLGKESTAELTTKDIDEVYDTLNRHLGQITGLYVPFPSVDELINEQRVKNDRISHK